MDDDTEEQMLKCILFDQDAFLDMRLRIGEHRQEEWKRNYFSEVAMSFQGEIIYSRDGKHKQFVTDRDTLAQAFRLFDIYILGSSQDGLYLEKGFKIIGPISFEVNDTDLDIVFEVGGVEILQEKDNSKLPYLLIEDSKTYPGYVKFRTVGHCDSFHNAPYFPSSALKWKLCSGLEISNFYVSSYCNTFLFPEGLTGPSLHGAIEDDMGIHNLDFVVTITMKEWPNAAKSFLSRERPSGWPSKFMIQEIAALGCGFVAVGHPNSEQKDVEWRISFTSAEKFLIKQLNAVQIRSYIFLKLLYRNYLEEPECLSSYMMKNVMFWTMETVRLNTWAFDNVLQCVEAMMCQLVCFLNAKNLPNYFVQKRNMIGHKNESDITKLHIKAREILDNLLEAIIKCTDSKHFPGLCDVSLSLLSTKLPFLPDEDVRMILSCTYYAMYLNIRLQAIRYKQNLSFKTFLACQVPTCRSMTSLVPPCAVSYLIEAIKLHPGLPCVQFKEESGQWILQTEDLRRYTSKWVLSSTEYRGMLKEVLSDQKHLTNNDVECLPEFDTMTEWADLTSQWSGGEPLVSSFIYNSLSSLH